MYSGTKLCRPYHILLSILWMYISGLLANDFPSPLHPMVTSRTRPKLKVTSGLTKEEQTMRKLSCWSSSFIVWIFSVQIVESGDRVPLSIKVTNLLSVYWWVKNFIAVLNIEAENGLPRPQNLHLRVSLPDSWPSRDIPLWFIYFPPGERHVLHISYSPHFSWVEKDITPNLTSGNH